MKKVTIRPRLAKALDKYESLIRANLDDLNVTIWNRRARQGHSLAQIAAKRGVCPIANRLWFLQTYCSALSYYTESFFLLVNGKFYDAWCKLEEVENTIDILNLNLFVPELSVGLAFLEELVSNWQALFPYKVFFSPEIVIKRAECSICGNDVGPWSKCNHRIKRVYCGKACYRIIRSMEFRAISIVLEPVQKYSVALIKNDDGTDQFTYDSVRWVRDRISNPFHGWKLHRTTRLRPHSDFSAISALADCPCGSSRTYESCCTKRAGVPTPHFQIGFEFPPPPELGNFSYFQG